MYFNYIWSILVCGIVLWLRVKINLGVLKKEKRVDFELFFSSNYYYYNVKQNKQANK